MNILILGLNYQPEPVGIGPYTTETAEFLAHAGHNVAVVCGKPYYPNWKIPEAFRRRGVATGAENGVFVHRVPHYVPAKPNGARRLIHHATFAFRSLSVMLRAAAQTRPDIIICIAPSLMSVFVARIVGRAFGAKIWLHIQDFEVEAAFATGLLRDGGWLAKIARSYEKWCLKGSKISTISPQMCMKLITLGVPETSIYEFRNWANIDNVKPLTTDSVYRARWNISTPYVALYSGSLGNKQGIEIIVEVARLLTDRQDITFVICGNGALREKLIAAAEGLPNIRFYDLQPAEMLPDLLGLATVHLLPQIAKAADLVLPSKLANMLASGRPVLAAASSNTGLALEVNGCGALVPPEDPRAMARALEMLLDDEALRQRYAVNGRARAEQRWSRTSILWTFEKMLKATAGGEFRQERKLSVRDLDMEGIHQQLQETNKSF